MFISRRILYPLLEQIVELYPQSIVYPFKLSYETLQISIDEPHLKHNLDKLHQQLDRSIPLVNEFIHALEYLNPQQQFDTWSKEFFHRLTTDTASRDIDQLRTHVTQFKALLFNDIDTSVDNDNEPTTANTTERHDLLTTKSQSTSIRTLFQQAIGKDIDNLFGLHGENLNSLSLGDARLALGSISLKLKTILHDKSNINNYSTWFSTVFRQQNRLLDKTSRHELEIPGQYTSKKKPLLEHHIKIVGFDEKLLVLHSLRLPKRLTIRGHDENDYRFLVKAGEDIRQDQRIEALFSIMNDLYDNDTNCNQSRSARIAIRTYKGKHYIRIVDRSTKIIDR
jgi:DNA-dependent protein kinase catalytic subunit